MNYSFITMWITQDGAYHSNTADYTDFDTAIGAFHNKFKPMQNDGNVSSFVLVLLDETGKRVKLESWKRYIPEPEAEEVIE